MKAALLSALLAASAFTVSVRSSAFCRATTCDPGQDDCERSAQGCSTLGKPLFWASRCLEVYVQANGAPSQGLSFALTKDSVTRAFGAWLSASCGGEAPLLDVHVLGPITCATAEYNATKIDATTNDIRKNANIVMFREDDWPYIGAEDTLGLTQLSFDTETGEIYDADLEINAFLYQFSAGDPVTHNDLDSVLTHEAGHMLGLAHTRVANATMVASYVEGTDALRTLASDDAKAVCAAYPPERVPSRTSCTPRHGFSDVCGAQQPANSGTSEGTDAEAAASATAEGARQGCAFRPGPPEQMWRWPTAALVAVLVFGVRCGKRSRRFS